MKKNFYRIDAGFDGESDWTAYYCTKACALGYFARLKDHFARIGVKSRIDRKAGTLTLENGKLYTIATEA